MEPEKNALQCLLSRRDLIRSSTAITIASMTGGLLSIAGCGGSHNSTGGSGAIARVEGRVDRSQIGGENLLVTTPYKGREVVAATGAFGASVSSGRVSVLVVHDGSDAIRGLVSAIPSSGKVSSPTCDADTTALSLVFLTPGILELDPAGAAARAAQIRGLSEFDRLVTLLAANLPTKTLPEVLSIAEVSSALEDLIQKYATLTTSRSDGVTPSAGHGGISGQVKSSADWHAAQLQLSNRSFRHVQAYRRDSNSGGAFGPESAAADGLFGVIKGATPLSFGSIFTATFGSATEWKDSLAADFGEIGAREYWVSGIGRRGAVGHEDPPFDIGSLADTAGSSFTAYVLFPVLDFLAGILGVAETLGSRIGALMNAASEFWEGYGNGTLIVDLINAVSEGSLREAAAVALDICVAILSAAAATVIASGSALVVGGVTLITVEAAPLILLFLGGIGISLAAANFMLASISWIGLPQTTRISFTGSGGLGEIVIS